MTVANASRSEEHAVGAETSAVDARKGKSANAMCELAAKRLLFLVVLVLVARPLSPRYILSVDSALVFRGIHSLEDALLAIYRSFRIFGRILSHKFTEDGQQHHLLNPTDRQSSSIRDRRRPSLRRSAEEYQKG